MTPAKTGLFSKAASNNSCGVSNALLGIGDEQSIPISRTTLPKRFSAGSNHERATALVGLFVERITAGPSSPL